MPPKCKPLKVQKNLPRVIIDEPSSQKRNEISDSVTKDHNNNNTNKNVTASTPRTVRELLALKQPHIANQDQISADSLEGIFEASTPNNSHSIKIKKVGGVKATANVVGDAERLIIETYHMQQFFYWN